MDLTCWVDSTSHSTLSKTMGATKLPEKMKNEYTTLLWLRTMSLQEMNQVYHDCGSWWRLERLTAVATPKRDKWTWKPSPAGGAWAASFFPLILQGGPVFPPTNVHPELVGGETGPFWSDPFSMRIPLLDSHSPLKGLASVRGWRIKTKKMKMMKDVDKSFLLW